MASSLSAAVVAVLCLVLAPSVSAGDDDCKSFWDSDGTFNRGRKCYSNFCCGTCDTRYCCSDYDRILTEDAQENCFFNNREFPGDFPGDAIVPVVPIVFAVSISIFVIIAIISCCVCPCCWIYKSCRKPQPVIATTRTTVTTTQPYPRQAASAAPTSARYYQGGPYPTYQPMPVQPGQAPVMYPGQHPAQGPPPMPAPPSTQGPPPTYQEATGHFYPMSYPTQPTPPTASDFTPQPAYNPAYMAPPNTG